ncbi:uncharacterized protein PgNI_02676 [Pyricularia grisea]|uniref:Uncharacterized protein n=1 Tax=Pyricularia grisea TaxID=148305 RepID=A0A6P8BEI8_PYRGI|nr:uncharacterized protein PgNI_02676 [Pyricularia grisea]TLD14112.1 hypothetical protein PgNI_02676 [Pyricularia grisea]
MYRLDCFYPEEENPGTVGQYGQIGFPPMTVPRSTILPPDLVIHDRETRSETEMADIIFRRMSCLDFELPLPTSPQPF